MKVGAEQAGLPVAAITNPTTGILDYPNAPGYPPDLAPDPRFMDLPDYAPSPGEYQYVQTQMFVILCSLCRHRLQPAEAMRLSFRQQKVQSSVLQTCAAMMWGSMR